MFIIDTIKAIWYIRQACKFEEKEAFYKRTKMEVLKDWFKTKFETKKARAVRLAREEEERRQFLEESDERLAMMLHDEDTINFICDFIKKHELVDGYK